MSGLMSPPDKNTTTEADALTNLTALATSGTGEFIRKTGTTTFENAEGGGSGGVAWGAITGTLSAQTDLQTALDAKQATITFGTGVETALGVNIGSAGAFVTFNGALGTPSSGTVTNLTGTASININGTVGATTPTTGAFTTATVDDEAYGVGWNGSLQVPTKNALYDKIETLSGLAWGASISGTTDGGLSLTLSDNSDNGAGALKITASNTQANKPILANLQIGTSTNVQGLLIQGTGSTSVGAAGTGEVHLSLWGNTSGLTQKALSVASGTSYTERLYITTGGRIVTSTSVSDSALISTTSTAEGDNGASLVEFVYAPPNDNQSNTYTNLLQVTQSSGRNMNTGIDVTMTNSSASLVAVTGTTENALDVKISRTLTGAQTRDDTAGSAARFLRTSVANHASANYTVSSAVFQIEQVATQTAGTLTVSGDILKLISPSAASFTGNIINGLNASTTVFKVAKTGVVTIGAASGTTGAIVFNGTTSGAVTLSVADAAGTYTLKLPTTDGASGEFLQTDGSGNTTWAAAGGTPKMLIPVCFETDGRYGNQSTNGTSTFGTAGNVMTTTATTTSYINRFLSFGDDDNAGVEAGSPTFSCRIANFLAIPTTASGYLGIGAVTVSGTGHTFTNKHIGFKVVVATGVASLYATQADGTTENASAALTTAVEDTALELILQVNSTTSVDYYWRKNEGALSSATNLTSNFPSGATNRMQWSLSNNSTANALGLTVNSSSYQR